MKQYKIAFLCSHVIQYLDPLFKKVSSHPEIDLTVFYYSKEGLERYKDREFGVELKWDRKLLDGYKYKFLKNFSPLQRVHNYFKYINIGVVTEIVKGGFDAVIIYGYGWFISWAAWVSAVISGTPIIFLGETNVLRSKHENSAKKKIKDKLLKIFFSRCGSVFYLGKKNREFYECLGVSSEKLFHWPYTVDNDFFIKNANRYRSRGDNIKKQYSIPADKVIIFFSGKLIEKKCPLDLIMAYEKMNSRDKVALVFAGDGPLRGDMEVYIRTNDLSDVYLLGFLNQTELAKVYAIADIFAFPSSFEPWGLSLNEAMCYSLPAVVSDEITAGYDLIKDSDNGFIFKSGDIDTLCDRLENLVRDEELRKKTGQRSFEIISSWDYKKDIEGLLAAMRHIKEKRGK
ncbi:MAG: glycosyltransferase family 4 protein [Candidatus Omnitrophota bacterium]|nr:glycosyltransferase family 4 protein [Candidatus Omnitrophota bacterium]